MADQFTILVGAAAPLLRDNVDTDSISPGSRRQSKATAEFSEKGSSNLAQELFANWRYDDAGRERPDFVLEPAALFEVDLAASRMITPSGRIVPFALPEFRRRGL